jgi:hypothetical protein
MNSSIQSNIELTRTEQGDVCLNFADPAYVQADTILINHQDASVHAVLHGAAHFVGHVSVCDAALLTHHQPILLTAPHYFRGAVHIRSTVSVI